MTSHLPSQLAQLASLLSNPPATASKHLPSLLLQRSIALLQLRDAVQALSESKEDVSKALEDYLWNVEREMSAEGGGKSSGGAVRASQERLLEALRASVEGFEVDWDKGVREFEAWEVKGGGRGWIDGVSRGSGTGADQGSTREEAVSGYLQQLVAEPRTLGSTLAQLSSEDPTLLSTLLPSTTTGKSKAPLEILLRLLENTRGAQGVLEFYIGLWESGIKSLTSPPSPSPSPSPSLDTPPSSTSTSRSASGEKELCDFLVSSLELLESLALSLPSPPSSSSSTSSGSDPMSMTHPGISAIFLQLFKDLRDLPLPFPVASPTSTRQSSVDRPSVLLGTRSFLGTLSDYSIGGITSVGSGFTSSMDVLGSTLGAGMDSIGLNSISNGIGAVGSGIGALGNGIGSGIRASGTGIASGIGAVGSGIGAVGMGIGAVGAGIGSEIGFGRLGIRRASSDVSIPPTPPLPASTSTPPPTFRPSPSRRASNRTFQPLTTLQLRSSTLLLQSLRPSFPPSSPRSLTSLLISHLLQTFPDGEARGKFLLLGVVRYYGFTYLGKRLSRPLSPMSSPRPTLTIPTSHSLPPPSKRGMEEKRMFEGTHLSTLEQETMVGIYRLIYGSLVSACGLGVIRGEGEDGEGDERKAWREAGEGFVKGWSQGPTFEVQGGMEDGVKVFKLSAGEFGVLFGSFSNLLLPPFTRPPSFKSTAFRPLSTAYPQDSDEDMGAGGGMRGVLRGIVRGFKDVEGGRADVLCFSEAGEVRLDITSGSSSIELAGGIGGAGGWISPPRSPRHEDLRTTMTPLPPILSVDQSTRWSNSEVSLLRKGIYSLSKSHFLPSSSSSDDLSTFTTALRSALIRATTNQDFIAQTLYTSLLSLFSTPPSPSQFSALLSSLLHPLLLSRSQHECETSLTMRRLESLDAQLEDLRTRARGERGSIDEGRVRAWYAFLRLSDPMRRLRAKIIDLQSGMEGAGGKGELAEWKKERGIVDFMRGSSELEVGMMWIQRYVSNTIEGDGGGIYASPFWERERRVLEGGEGAVLSFGAASLSLLRNGEEKVMGRSCEDHLERIGMKLTGYVWSDLSASILRNRSRNGRLQGCDSWFTQFRSPLSPLSRPSFISLDSSIPRVPKAYLPSGKSTGKKYEEVLRRFSNEGTVDGKLFALLELELVLVAEMGAPLPRARPATMMVGEGSRARGGRNLGGVMEGLLERRMSLSPAVDTNAFDLELHTHSPTPSAHDRRFARSTSSSSHLHPPSPSIPQAQSTDTDTLLTTLEQIILHSLASLPTLFQDLQLISSLAPPAVLDTHFLGKAYWDFSLAALSVKKDVVEGEWGVVERALGAMGEGTEEGRELAGRLLRIAAGEESEVAIGLVGSFSSTDDGGESPVVVSSPHQL